MTKLSNFNPNLLVIEDNEQDFETLSRILKQLSFKGDLYHCLDGDDALDFLYNKGEYNDKLTSPTPNLILLDLNLPGTDGRDVLKQIKNDIQLKIIPVVIFTTSSNEQDIKICYERGANTYILKPMNIETMKAKIENLLIHWFDVSIIP